MLKKTLPIFDSVNEVSTEQIRELMDIGFCYIQLPNKDKAETALEKVRTTALGFFRHQDKKEFPFNADKAVGFADREYSTTPQTIKQFMFRPKEPIGPFKEIASIIEEIREEFHDNIALKLLKKIFTEVGCENIFNEACEETFSTLSISYYPDKPTIPCEKGVNPHKDFDLITILAITQPGLEVLYNEEWIPVDPKPGYVVVNLANALELMLGKQTKSAAHQVRITEERLSIGLFIGPKPNAPVKDYTTNTTYFKDYNEYLEDQFNKFYSSPNTGSLKV